LSGRIGLLPLKTIGQKATDVTTIISPAEDLSLLEEKFKQVMLNVVQAIRDKGWQILPMWRMGIKAENSAHDVVQAARKMMEGEQNVTSETFAVPELTVEYYVLLDEFRPLFTLAHRWTAWERLKPQN
jgi:hypothetical protein